MLRGRNGECLITQKNPFDVVLGDAAAPRWSLSLGGQIPTDPTQQIKSGRILGMVNFLQGPGRATSLNYNKIQTFNWVESVFSGRNRESYVRNTSLELHKV